MSIAQEFADRLRSAPALNGVVTVHVLPMGTLSVSHKKNSHKPTLSWSGKELAKTSYEQVLDKITAELLLSK